MRIFCISDIHVEYEENRRWVENLSRYDYKQDILVLAGDVTDKINLLEKALKALRNCFLEVVFVPGNHDLWVFRNKDINSLEKLYLIKQIASNSGVLTEPYHNDYLTIVPLLGWYDYSFGQPVDEILINWVDYWACKWPADFDVKRITEYFIKKNEQFLHNKNVCVISFSHFLPRIDLMPFYIPQSKRKLYPVLGSTRIEEQIRELGSNVHIYGHSHVNREVYKDDILYINNAFGYPYETLITRKKLFCIKEI